MHAQFFRSFYLVFIGLFVQLLFGTMLVMAVEVRDGNALSAMAAAGMAALCSLLITRALNFMRE